MKKIFFLVLISYNSYGQSDSTTRQLIERLDSIQYEMGEFYHNYRQGASLALLGIGVGTLGILLKEGKQDGLKKSFMGIGGFLAVGGFISIIDAHKHLRRASRVQFDGSRLTVRIN